MYFNHCTFSCMTAHLFVVACYRIGCCVHDACACDCRLLIGIRTSCGDDVTHGDAAVVMTTAVGVACFVGGALASALVVGVICHRQRPARYVVSRTTKTDVYREAPASTGAPPRSLPSSDFRYGSMDTEDVFVSPQLRLTVSDASLKRQLMLRSTESFRSMRTKLDSVDDDDAEVM